MILQTTKDQPQWICWSKETRDGRETKVPKSPLYDGNASCTNPKTWGTYEQAVDAVSAYGYTGIGIILTNGISGIDIDGNRKSGEQNPSAEDVLDLFKDTYIERSPSKTGYHILFYCDESKLPLRKTEDGKPVIGKDGLKTLDGYYKKNSKKELEIYLSSITNRFFTFTGDTINCNSVTDATTQTIEFLNRYMRKETVENDKTDAELEKTLTKARNASNGKRFIALFDEGDTQDYAYDDSRADLALCSMLAYWCNGNQSLVEKAFYKSALCREKWVNRSDYRASTIDKACTQPIKPKEAYLPMVTGSTKPEKPALTIESFEACLAGEGIEVHRNSITHNLEINGIAGEYDPETIQDTLGTILYNTISKEFRCTLSTINSFIDVIAGKYRYNPVQKILHRASDWDGRDRVEQLFEIMGIPEYDSLSRTLIHKWLLQALAMAVNSVERPYGADGVLVLQGNQGIGKTSLCQKLGIDSTLCKTGLYVDTRDKDTIIRCTSCWIGELGEIGCTMKSDVDRLKSFITESVDRYRIPYGRKDNSIVRRAVFIATTNDERFLIDPTGSRRFWTVNCPERFNLESLNQFDSVQLWKQIEKELFSNPFSSEFHSAFQDSFRLSVVEQEELAERNRAYIKPIKGQFEIEDIICRATSSSSFRWDYLTTTQFKDLYPQLFQFDVATIGKALTACGIESTEKRDGNGVPSHCRFLPVPTSRSES